MSQAGMVRVVHQEPPTLLHALHYSYWYIYPLLLTWRVAEIASLPATV